MLQKRSPNDESRLCQKCHENCTQSSPQNSASRNSYVGSDANADAFLDCNSKWTDLPVPTLLSPVEPFNPVPGIAITPPDTPQPALGRQEFSGKNEIQVRFAEHVAFACIDSTYLYGRTTKYN